MNQIKALLAAHYPLLRIGINALIENIATVRIVAEASDGRKALQLIRKHRPHVVLMDLEVPPLGGLKTMAQVAKEFPKLPVLILSTTGNEDYSSQALRAGAAGLLMKTASGSELVGAIKAVASGKSYISRYSKLPLTDRFRRGSGESKSLERLTPRQREVLKLIAEGKSTKEIALILNLSGKTIESHRRELAERLAIHDTAGLVRYAINAGLIRLEDWLNPTKFEREKSRKEGKGG